jgi:hypothetical protein
VTAEQSDSTRERHGNDADIRTRLWTEHGIRLARLADIEARPIEWLWQGRIARKMVTILQGDPELGKSRIATCIAARVTTGAPMPDDWQFREPMNVILYAEEDPIAEVLRPSLDAAGADPDRIYLVSAERAATGTEDEAPPMFSTDGLRRLEAAVSGLNAGLVIVDPFSSYLPSDIDSHRDQDVRRVLRPLAAIAARTGAAVVIIRHMTQNAREKRGQGSIGIRAVARLEQTVERHGDHSVLQPSKSNPSERAASLCYRIVNAPNGAGVVEWLAADCDEAAEGAEAPRRGHRKRRDNKMATKLRAGQKCALEIARDAGGVTSTTVAAAMGTSKVNASRDWGGHLAVWERQGLLGHAGRGGRPITPLGLSALADQSSSSSP